MEALAAQQGARALLFPTMNAGTNYHSHTGNLQRSSGRILNLNEKSLYLGGVPYRRPVRRTSRP